MLIDEAETVTEAEHERLMAKVGSEGLAPTFDVRLDTLGMYEAALGAARASGRRRGVSRAGHRRVARP